MTATGALLEDAFERVHELYLDVTNDLNHETAQWRPEPSSNPIVWLLWHLARVQDDHISELAGKDQVWTQFRERFGLDLPSHDTGFGHQREQVAKVDAPVPLLREYHEAVHQLTQHYVVHITDDELSRIIDHRWQPAVTVSGRLVSVNGDCLQHLGQAAYIRGMAKRS